MSPCLNPERQAVAAHVAKSDMAAPNGCSPWIVSGFALLQRWKDLNRASFLTSTAAPMPWALRPRPRALCGLLRLDHLDDPESPTRCPSGCSSPMPRAWPIAAGMWSASRRWSPAAMRSPPAPCACRAIPSCDRGARPERSSPEHVPAFRHCRARGKEFHDPIPWTGETRSRPATSLRSYSPAEKSRPCLIVELDQAAGEAVVGYGTSRWSRTNRGQELHVTGRADCAAASLDRPTRFVGRAASEYPLAAPVSSRAAMAPLSSAASATATVRALTPSATRTRAKLVAATGGAWLAARLSYPTRQEISMTLSQGARADVNII